MNIQSVNEIMAANYPTIPAIETNDLDGRWPELILENFATLGFEEGEVGVFLGMDDEDKAEVVYRKYVENLVDILDNQDEYYAGLDEVVIEGIIRETKKQLMELGHDYDTEFAE